MRDKVLRLRDGEVEANQALILELVKEFWVVPHPTFSADSRRDVSCFPDVVLRDQDGDWCVAIECKVKEDLQSCTQALGQCLLYKTKARHVVWCTASPHLIPSMCAEVAKANGIHITSYKSAASVIRQIASEITVDKIKSPWPAIERGATERNIARQKMNRERRIGPAKEFLRSIGILQPA